MTRIKRQCGDSLISRPDGRLSRKGMPGRKLFAAITDRNSYYNTRRLAVAVWLIPLLLLVLVTMGWGIVTLVVPRRQQFVIESEDRIPGTLVSGEALQRRLDCFSRKGRWVLNDTPRLLPWFVVPGEDWYWTKCDKRHVSSVPGGIFGADADDVALGLREGECNVREGLKYEWEVNDTSCGWSKFDRVAFCRAVGRGRNVMFLGDSLSWGLHSTFINHMYMKGSRPDPVVVGRETQRKFCTSHVAMCDDVLGGGGFNFTHRRNVYLTVGNWSRLTGDQWQQDWFDDVERERISILVVNRGAWYVPDANFTRDLNATLVALRARHPDLLIIFRNTVPGHADCEFAPPRPLETPHWNFTQDNWEKFKHQNELVRPLVKAVGGVIMDVYTMTVLRADGHPLGPLHDCLHYCMPGPMDTWLQLLHNILLYT